MEKGKFTSQNQPYTTNKSQHNFPPKATSWRNNQPNKPSKGRSPHKNGQPTSCNIYQSINHCYTQFPGKNMNDIIYMVHGIILQSSIDLLSHVLLSETWCSAVLDLGASNTVHGRLWFNEYMESLSKEDKSKVLLEGGSKPFRFDDGKQFVSSTTAILPANIGQHRVSIRTNIIGSNIPLLLSRATMKNGQIGLSFQNYTYNPWRRNSA